MKAFKQISLKNELRALWIYSSVLSLVSVVILISPAFAQQKDLLEERPHLENERDPANADSSWCWHWKGSHFKSYDNDSMRQAFHNHYNKLMQGVDSLDYADWSDFIDHDFFKDIPNLHWADINFPDSIRKYFHNQGEEIVKFFPDEKALENMHKQNEAFVERFKEYSKEHQRLLEKYFYDFRSEDLVTENDPTK